MCNKDTLYYLKGIYCIFNFFFFVVSFFACKDNFINFQGNIIIKEIYSYILGSISCTSQLQCMYTLHLFINKQKIPSNFTVYGTDNKTDRYDCVCSHKILLFPFCLFYTFDQWVD